MSNIPNSAMPKAGAQNDFQSQGQSGQFQGQSGQFESGQFSSEQDQGSGAFSQLADKAREYPKTAIAAGAAVAAGVAAAAVLSRGRGKNESEKSSGGKSGTSKKSRSDRD
ncbi:MAG: hypothetical protein M3177_06315 [Pseudomonadota bacterium]|nr:hypothetical protein [Pseudomonadota bacterium]